MKFKKNKVDAIVFNRKDRNFKLLIFYCNGTRTNNHLIRKQTLNNLASMAK